MELTAQNVEQVFEACLFRKAGVDERKVKVEGVMLVAGLLLDQVEEQRPHISDFLDQLPWQFQEKKGGGWTFLNMCVREDGTEWAGEQVTMDKLLVLGMAIGRVAITLPREIWAVFPGGVPYVVVSE